MKQVKVQLGDDRKAIAVVCDNRPEGSPRARIRDNAPHAHYALEREDIAVELQAFLALCKAIRSDVPAYTERVLELFGGSGWHTALIDRQCSPMYHEAWDISQDCVDSIRAAGRSVVVQCCNSIQRIALPVGHPDAVRTHFDWVHADYNNLTHEMLLKDGDIRRSFQSLFSVATGLVTFTETGMYGKDKTRFESHCKEMVANIEMNTKWWHMSSVGWGPACMHAFTKIPVVNPSIKFALYNTPLKVQVIA